MRLTASAALALALTACPVSAQDRPSLVLPTTLAVVGQTTDWTTTVVALGQPGLREGNGMMSGASVAQMGAIKAGATAGAIMLARSLRSHGHPRAAKVLLYVFAGTGGSAAIWNTRQIIKAR